MGEIFIDYDGTDKINNKKKALDEKFDEIIEMSNLALNSLYGHENIAPETVEIINDIVAERDYIIEEKEKISTFYADYTKFVDEANDIEITCVKNILDRTCYPCSRPMNNQSDSDWRKDFANKFMKESIVYCVPGSGALGIKQSKDEKKDSNDKKKKDEQKEKPSVIRSSDDLDLAANEYISKKSKVGDKLTFEISQRGTNGSIESVRKLQVNNRTGEVIEEVIVNKD